MKNKVHIYLIIIALVCTLVTAFILFNKQTIQEEDNQTVAQVKTILIQKKMIIQSVVVNGVIVFSPMKMQEINFNSEVVVDKIFIRSGQVVKKGDLLLKLSLSPAEQVNLINAKSAYSFAEKEYRRQIDLRDRYLASNLDVQNALQGLSKSRAELDNLLTTINKIKKPVTADIDGVIENLNAQLGEVIPRSTSLITIGNSLQANYNIPADLKDKIAINKQVLISSLNNPDRNTLSNVDYISGKIDQNSATTYFTASVAESSDLIAGEPVVGRVYVGEPESQLYIPKTALVYDGEIPYIFLNKNGLSKKESINVLFKDDDNVYIQSPSIHVGDEVVYHGNYELENNMKLRVESM